MWQEMIVGLCVLAALGFVVYRYFPAGKKKAACGGCSGCGDKKGCGPTP